MTFALNLVRRLLVLLAGLALSGCLPSAQSQLDEEREPHFLEGKNRVSSLDYKGAVEDFEKALEVNPHSASAHFELGCLFDQKEADPAAAIYHYEHYLRLRPRAENAEIVRQHIMACKQELAKTVSLGPVTEKVQRELEQATVERQRLMDENTRLRDELEKWRAYATGLQALTNRLGDRQTPSRPAVIAGAVGKPGPGATNTELDSPTRLAGVATASRTHTVKPGETPMGIARQYGIKVEVLLAANPAVNPRRLQIGQTLSIPSPLKKD